MELAFLRWLNEQIPRSGHVPLGIGDDAALLSQQTGKQTVVTTDMLMDGTDFILSECGPRSAGRKALAVNLSDLAAMGAKPVAAFVSLALPHTDDAEHDLKLAQELLFGMLPLAQQFSCSIAGGDTNRWPHPLVINVTAIGEVPHGRAWQRSGAKPGDAILLTGACGGSILGHHFEFEPRLQLASELQNLVTRDPRVRVHAAIDISDGLSLDLSRLCTASGCGAMVELAQVPIAAAAHELAARDPSHTSPLDRALSDGEDFELILAVPPETAKLLLREQPLGTPLTQIGWFTADKQLTQQLASGEIQPLVPRGYEH
jgi:thiamine-monophosphate kinase